MALRTAVYSVTYQVTLPEKGTVEYNALRDQWWDEENSHDEFDLAELPEDEAEEAIDDNMVPWMVSKFGGGDFTEYVQEIDDDLYWRA